MGSQKIPSAAALGPMVLRVPGADVLSHSSGPFTAQICCVPVCCAPVKLFLRLLHAAVCALPALFAAKFYIQGLSHAPRKPSGLAAHHK